MSNSYRPWDVLASRTGRVLLAIWLLMTLLDLAFVLHFGRNAPWADEWEMVPGLVNEEPLLPWLWYQHNEHRLPLPRSVFWLSFQATHDFRTGMVLQVVMLSGLSLALMHQAARLRGKVHLADAFFPVQLLNWGHVENSVMGYQICFVLTTTVLLGMYLLGQQSPRRHPILLGLLLWLLMLTGGSGMTYLPAIGLWLAYTAWCLWSTQRRTAVILIAILALSVAYLGLYLVGYSRPAAHAPPAWNDPVRIGTVVSQLLGMGVGYSGIDYWPYSTVIVAGLVLYAVGVCLHTAFVAPPTEEKPDRERLLFMATLFLGTLTLIVAIAIGRSGFRSPTIGLWSRYSILVTPMLVYVYWAGLTLPRCRYLPALLLTMAAVALPPNMYQGYWWASGYAYEMDVLEYDIRTEGMTPEQAYENNRYLKDTERKDQVLRGIPLLKKHAISYFGEAKTP